MTPLCLLHIWLTWNNCFWRSTLKVFEVWHKIMNMFFHLRSKVSKLFPATSLWNSHVLFLHLHPYFSSQFETVSFVFEIDQAISSNFFRWSFALWNETSMVIYYESLNQPCGSLAIFYNKRFACIIWDKVTLKSYWI